jgi:radical SAM protein with 4Fe4S-binding SPASM domain
MLNITRLYCGKKTRSDRLRYKKSGFAPVAVYNCTPKCSLNCRHCYSFADSEKNSEISTEQAKDLINQLAEVNCPVILFSGGEPLQREDIFELIQKAKKMNIRAVLSTNGTLIDKRTAARLSESGLSYAGISIDGDKDYHNEFRGDNQAYQKAIQGIKNCIETGLKVGLRFTITKDNFTQVGDIFELAESLGVRRICFYHLVNTGKAVQSKIRPEPEQTRQAVDTIIEKAAEFASKDAVDEVLTVGNHADAALLLYKMEQQGCPDFKEAVRLLRAKSENANGKGITCINWDGTVFIDQFTRDIPLGNVTERSFKQIWYESNNHVLQKLRDRSFYPDPRCRLCRFTDICRSNPHLVSTNNGKQKWRNEPPCYLEDKIIHR